MIVTAGTLEEARGALELVKPRPNLYSTVGVHPTRSLEFFGSDGGGGEGGGSGADPEAHVAALAAVLEEGKALGKVGVHRMYTATVGGGKLWYWCAAVVPVYYSGSDGCSVHCNGMKSMRL